jgi:2-C-methyl-D-erythritol 2,4-cyclodiphosphate synthase
MIRSGLGFDLHPVVQGRPLVLGGVTVPGERGLGGHSDADVLSHAIGEALLGALALGDLGRLYPDSDPRYRDASSLVLLAGVMERLRANGGRLVNVDATVICQAPRLAPYLPEMVRCLAETLGLSADGVSVKAKSPEHLGLLGREEGIAAMAVVSVDVRSARRGAPPPFRTSPPKGFAGKARARTGRVDAARRGRDERRHGGREISSDGVS